MLEEGRDIQLSLFEGGEVPFEELNKEIDKVDEIKIDTELMEELPNQMNMFTD